MNKTGRNRFALAHALASAIGNAILPTRRGRLLAGLGAAMLGLLLPASALPAPGNSEARTTASAAGAAADAATETRRLVFSKLSNRPVLQLRTSQGSASVDFGMRGDEVATALHLKLRYVYSPALIPVQSHIRVVLNGEVMSVIPVTRENAGRPLEIEMDLDPRFVTDFNKLSLEFVGHYTGECEDPLHTSLWADISGTSEMLLTTRRVAVVGDLARLPQPFFDPRDSHRLTLPYVFPAQPSKAMLRAAGVTSSWFGRFAAWRGARFPAFLDSLPKGHAVAFATNTERPAFLAGAEPFKGPGVSIVANPGDGYSRLLLITGRDDKDLLAAARTLVLGTAALSGTHVDISHPLMEAPRKPYDAPSWVRLDRPMKFGELVSSPQQLQVFGHVPDPIRLDLRIPPDLYIWRSPGVPVHFKFRYTAPIRASESRLAMSVNDELVEAVNLRPAGQGSDLVRVALPGLVNGMFTESRDALIPAYKLKTRNQLQYAFAFTYHKEGSCRDTQVEDVRAMIDPDSTIDFSGYPHYAELPNLGYFATAGFPFTKYADLAQTTVVLPKAPTAKDIEVMLSVLGRMGEATGYPATRVAVAGPEDTGALKDRDLIVIGTAPHQPLLRQWSRRLPAAILGDERRISQPVRSVSFLYDWFGFDTKPDLKVATEEQLRGDGPLAAMLGFESPLTSGRSVVAITAVRDANLSDVLDSLDDQGAANAMYGSAVFVRDGKSVSVLAGDTYTLGVFPFWLSLWYPLVAHPLLLWLLELLGGLLVLYALWRGFRRLTGGAGRKS